jgi:hypothetical protein
MADITKNSREVIRITREDFRGHELINLRVFYDAGDGDLRPGKQGIAFRTPLLPDVLRALGALATEGAV